MIILSWVRRNFPSPPAQLFIFSYVHEAAARVAAEAFPSQGKKSFLDRTILLSGVLRSSPCLSETQMIHAHLVRTGICSSLFLQNTLLYSYLFFGSVGDARRLFASLSNPNTISHNVLITGLANSGRVGEARKVFDEMALRDSASWNSLMSGYFRHGELGETIKIFRFMVQDPEVELDVFSLTIAMKACGALLCYELGLQLHGLATKMRIGRSIQIERSLIDMHIKCGATYMASDVFERLKNPDLFCLNSMILCYSRLYDVEYALQFFERMLERDTVSWNTMISVLLQRGRCWDTLSMIIDMQAEGYQLTSTTYTCGLTACAHISHLDWGRHLHACILKFKLIIDVFVGSSLVDLYAKCGKLNAAKRVFDSLPHINTVSWTSLIGGFAQFGHIEEALTVFTKMRRKQMSLDHFTLSTMISTCYNGMDMDILLGCQLHCLCLRTGFSPSIPVSNALLTMYAKCGATECAESIFYSMALKDVISWTSMISAYSQSGNVLKAREFFNFMAERNVVSWNAMFGAYIENGEEEEAVKLFVLMLREDEVRPDWVTFVRLLSAAAYMGALKVGIQIIAHATKLGLSNSNTSVLNGIITMYSKSGKIVEARRVFDLIEAKDLISWNTMITAYAQHGLGREAVDTFEALLLSGNDPDYISYVAVLSGCSHSGLVSKGKQYFQHMVKVHKITPGIEHYACMVDLLGRAGFLGEAKRVIEEMPIKPTAEVWGAFLSACKIHQNTKLAEHAANHLFELDSKDSGSYILLAKLHADVGNLDYSAGVRKIMKERGIRKKPGCSWIEVDNRIHSFIAADINHPEITSILKELDKLMEMIGAIGYANEDRGLRSKRHHSEKLAMAFGVMKLPSWMPVCIMKNLRICSDCHTVIKLVSLVCEREFVVRDAVRFHHFKQGSCSCGEYW
ncbi:Pentatricopeptide repeat-containing protein [Apostasia shenzhenica]|uniref:Pentatricopeptide repeat-containing protein n=1 Tax=Apostasia shenzhenica TaxID=1088818 RepID=A0A2I0A9C9_9ASPA|nr:Pentatricopeptide repeat-containing protein [Apostasia shenzhenica]